MWRVLNDGASRDFSISAIHWKQVLLPDPLWSQWPVDNYFQCCVLPETPSQTEIAKSLSIGKKILLQHSWQLLQTNLHNCQCFKHSMQEINKQSYSCIMNYRICPKYWSTLTPYRVLFCLKFNGPVNTIRYVELATLPKHFFLGMIGPLSG